MDARIYSLLEIREVFHLEFLRWFGRKLEGRDYALKGGVNLRFFFRSIRYSEDMDLDIQKLGVERVKKTVMDTPGDHSSFTFSHKNSPHKIRRFFCSPDRSIIF